MCGRVRIIAAVCGAVLAAACGGFRFVVRIVVCKGVDYGERRAGFLHFDFITARNILFYYFPYAAVIFDGPRTTPVIRAVEFYRAFVLENTVFIYFDNHGIGTFL